MVNENTTSQPAAAGSVTTIERKSDRELVATCTFNAKARLVFEAWTRPEILMKWWVQESCGISFISCDIDARAGGGYRFVFGHPASEQPMAFFGKYIEFTPHSRLVWTNDESGDGAVTTVTFKEIGAKTLLTFHELYPSKEALNAAIDSGGPSAMPEQFEQLDGVLRARSS